MYLSQHKRQFRSTYFLHIYIYIKVKWSRYRPGVAQRVGRGIALLFLDRGTRRWWVVSSTLRPHFTPGKDQVPILQEAEWAPGPLWKGGKSRPHRDSIPDRPHTHTHTHTHIYIYICPRFFLQTVLYCSFWINIYFSHMCCIISISSLWI